MKFAPFFTLFLFATAGLLCAEEPKLTPEAFDQNILYFFEETCIDCHGDTKQKGDRRFDTLAYPIVDDNMLVDFQDALDQLNLGEMPPKGKTQPADEEKASVIKWLTAAIDQKQKARTNTGGETVLRRLNRREYRNTVADLFDLEMDGFDPTEGFPADEEEHHLDNQGHALVTSGFLLDKYLDAAEQVIDKALPPLEKPKRVSRTFDGHFIQHEVIASLARIEVRQKTDRHFDYLKKIVASLPSQSSPEAIAATKVRAQDSFDNMMKAIAQVPTSMRLYENPRSQRHVGSYGYVADFAEGVPHDGYYTIAVYAEPMHLDSPLAKSESNIDPDHPMILAIVPGDQKSGDLHLPQPIEPELARFELTKPKRGKYQADKVWLNKGQTPRFTWVNGSDRARSAHLKVGKKLQAAKGIRSEGGNDAVYYGLEHGNLPYIKISEVYISGPHYSEWPTQTQKKLLGGAHFNPDKNRENIRSFLTRAYRRPPTAGEIDRILGVISTREQEGITPWNAYRDGLKAALCSPGFMYLEEPVRKEDKNTLDSYAIASRLSYFLWSSMPDAELLKLAQTDQLKDPNVRLAQSERMLRDPKSNRFVKDFLTSWLALGSLGETQPDRRTFAPYYNDDLESAMKQETYLFARHLLDENRSIDQFINSTFTFVNRGLADLYNLDVPLDGSGFQKVAVVGKPRGGLLGQASVLTATANGVDTSPIVRGVWMLENLLGTPTPPPPPDIEPLDPDIRGAKTFRDQFEKHRANASCTECHRKIDPLGFALENFDAIGRWRSKYKGGPIDPSGVMPNGTTFRTVSEFKTALMKDKHKFHRALTEKLMAYALGRHLDISDRPEIDAILNELNAHDNDFRFLVKRIALGKTFIEP